MKTDHDRRTTVQDLARHLAGFGLLVDPDAMIRDMEGMEKLATAPKQPEGLEVIEALEKLALGAMIQ